MPTWTQVRDTLAPVVRAVSAPAQALHLRTFDPVAAPIRRAVAPMLHVLLAWEDRELRRFVAQRHLDAWRLDADTAFGEALAGLDPVAGLVHSPSGCWELRSDDGAAASRIALPGWLAAFRGRVPGEPIAAIPHARLVRVGGSADPAQVDAVREAAAEWTGAADPISPVVYTDGLVPLDPDGPEVRALAVHVYEAQRRILEDDLDERLVPCAVAGGRSTARWVDGGLLPEVDLVEHDGQIVAFSELPGLVCVDLDPPRWRARGWPTAPRATS